MNDEQAVYFDENSETKRNASSNFTHIVVKLLILLLGFGLGVVCQILFFSKLKQANEVQNIQTVDDKSEQVNAEISRPGEKASYQFIAGVPAQVYFYDDYGFDVEFLSESSGALFEQFPDIEFYLEDFLKKFDYFIGELDSLAVAVDVENQKLYAALEIQEGQDMNAVFLAESEIDGSNFEMTAFDVQVGGNIISQTYTSQSVLGFYPSQRAILIQKREGGIPCIKNSYELMYKNGSSKKVAQSLEGQCADNAEVLLNFDGEYLFFAKIAQADHKYDLYEKGTSVPRHMVDELYKLHPLTGTRTYSSQDFSQAVWLIPSYAGYDYHSSTFDTSMQRGKFSPAGGVMLENAELMEDSFLEIK